MPARRRRTSSASGPGARVRTENAAVVYGSLIADAIRRAALPPGLVDVKACAVGDIWSGLKPLIRKELR